MLETDAGDFELGDFLGRDVHHPMPPPMPPIPHHSAASHAAPHTLIHAAPHHATAAGTAAHAATATQLCQHGHGGKGLGQFTFSGLSLLFVISTLACDESLGMNFTSIWPSFIP